MGYLLAFTRWIQGMNPWLHCWHDPREDDFLAAGASCLLLFHHWGPHRYVPDRDITVKFKREE